MESGIRIYSLILQEANTAATAKVQQGQNLSSAMRSTGVFPKMLVFMMGLVMIKMVMRLLY